MMLSDTDIRMALKNGELAISPFADEFIRSCGVTLHLGHQLMKPLPGNVVDVKHNLVPKFQEIYLTADKPYKLEPSEFVLGHTLQTVSVGQSLSFLIEGRSTLARVGLTIVQTAMLVYPGHTDRTVTLELANHGPNAILLYPRMKIARVVLIRLETPSAVRYDDNGKYREQSSVGPPIFKDEIWEE